MSTCKVGRFLEHRSNFGQIHFLMYRSVNASTQSMGGFHVLSMCVCVCVHSLQVLPMQVLLMQVLPMQVLSMQVLPMQVLSEQVLLMQALPMQVLPMQALSMQYYQCRYYQCRYYQCSITNAGIISAGIISAGITNAGITNAGIINAGITNAEFICGKAEDVLPSLMWRLSGQEVVMVVDPPRAGLRRFHLISALLLFLFVLFVY